MKRNKGPVVADPTAIGNVSSPAFVYLPYPDRIFSARALRLRQLAAASDLAPYLTFLAGLAEAQNSVQPELQPATAPDAARIVRANEFEMPLLDRNETDGGPALQPIFDRLFAATASIDKPPVAARALERVANASSAQRAAMARTVFSNILPDDEIAEHLYIWSGLQVHFARLASTVAASAVKPVADGVCPVCGGSPSASMVVDWPGAHGARFCACSLCGTLWHYVRIKCVLCGSTKGIGYQGIEGHDSVVKAETCDECQHWVKIFYQDKEPGTDPVADDVASLGLDMLMREGPYRRGGFAPLLAGL